jgi:hypothetical protein
MKIASAEPLTTRSMVENYVDRYPSQLPGGALEGALPPGRDDTPAKSRRPDKPEYDATSIVFPGRRRGR